MQKVIRRPQSPAGLNIIMFERFHDEQNHRQRHEIHDLQEYPQFDQEILNQQRKKSPVKERNNFATVITVLGVATFVAVSGYYLIQRSQS
ncbi:hypothetical protein RRG08_061444 [Elysia crispata]|uniref:Uncharacterized protein n=1 Tax=Elysia crispata TaxID=231223 RepID=A0AAE0YTS2_9GAST|nr:hypothetical protein RRG08_061444 [Elysia crispata]